jgi:replicative DNA helicase
MTVQRYFIAQVLWKPAILSLSAVRSEHFLVAREREVYKAIEDIAYRGEEVNEFSVAKELKWKMSDIFPFKPDDIVTASWEYYQGEVLEQYRQHIVKQAVEKIMSDKYLSADEMLEQIAQATTDVQIKAINRVRNGREIQGEALYRYEERSVGEKERPISTGIESLDDVFDGFKKRLLYYVGARPSQGKSALLMNFATNTNAKALFFTAESSGEELMDRIIVRQGRFDSKLFNRGRLVESDRQKLYGLDRRDNLFIYYDGDLDMQKISAISYSYKRTHDIKIIFVDYLQLIRPRNLSIPRHEQVAEISIRLKQLANDLNVPVVCAVQLRRDAENATPILSDFSDSTQIERDADVAILIHNFVVKEVISENGDIRENKICFLKVEKNRNGERQNVLVDFQSQYFHFQSHDIEEEARLWGLVKSRARRQDKREN